ncbi:hypothetical protein C8J57DRAFT_1301760, partial [Mycena rebaudengoi]
QATAAFLLTGASTAPAPVPASSSPNSNSDESILTPTPTPTPTPNPLYPTLRPTAAPGARCATASASHPRRRSSSAGTMLSAGTMRIIICGARIIMGSLIIWVWPIPRAPCPPRSTTARSYPPRWRVRLIWAWGSACRMWAGAAYPALVLMPMVMMGWGVVELEAVMVQLSRGLVRAAGSAEQHKQERPRPAGCPAFPAYARCRVSFQH